MNGCVFKNYMKFKYNCITGEKNKGPVLWTLGEKKNKKNSQTINTPSQPQTTIWSSVSDV